MKFENFFQIGHGLYISNHKMLVHIVKGYIKFRYYCDIPVRAEIAPDAYFCHNAFGVVINLCSKIGGYYY